MSCECFNDNAFLSDSFLKSFHFSNLIMKLFSDCNGTRTHNQLVRKQTLNHLAKLANSVKMIGLSVRLRTKWLWLRVPLQSLNFRFPACFEQGLSWHSGNYIECGFTVKCVRDMMKTYSQYLTGVYNTMDSVLVSYLLTLNRLYTMHLRFLFLVYFKGWV